MSLNVYCVDTHTCHHQGNDTKHNKMSSIFLLKSLIFRASDAHRPSQDPGGTERLAVDFFLSKICKNMIC